MIKRAYAPAEEEDGFRVLVDRLWPRGESKEALKLDLWEKEVAPSTEVRKAFGHVAENYERFRKDYLLELEKNPVAAEFAETVEEKLKKEPVTLVYGAKDETINQAVVLKEWLERHMRPGKDK
ncbi:MAG: DUF488 family protein [Eubacteriales bacterium]|nr:DUF488 family protein [Eubacteriales bacterium]